MFVIKRCLFSWLLLNISSGYAWITPHTYVTHDSRLHVTRNEKSSTASTTEGSSSNSGAISWMMNSLAVDDPKSRLASAFAALDETDQYDAVLTGLCAKILDSKDLEAKTELDGPIQLLQEMNARRVKASGRGLMALIDATILTQDTTVMADMMSLCLRNGGLTRFGSLQSTLTPFPSNPTSIVRTVDGTRKSRRERLDDLPDLPLDDRGAEVSSAFAFSFFAAFCGLTNFLGMSDITPVTDFLLIGMVLFGIVDNAYDVLALAPLPLKQRLPDKKDLPLQLGTGQTSGTVFRGLVRLTTVDTERDCECEAAALFAAYSLGLPCFAFRPNALESAVMIVESMKKESRLDRLLSSVGVLKVLVWLLAPVAMESAKHPQLIMSDPRESMGLLERLEDKANLLKDGDLFWTVSDQEKTDLLKWAYTEADLLLRSNKAVVTEISQRLAGGAATVGDCIAVIEDW